MKTNQQVEAIIWRRGKNGLEFLIAKRTEERGGFWQPLTGGVELGESLENAVKREIQEEFAIFKTLNLEPLNFRFQYVMKDGRALNEEAFSVEVAPETTITLSDEHTEYRWCSQQEAEPLLIWEDNREALRRVAIANQPEKPFVRIPAVAGIVSRHDKCLILQRGANDNFANSWEIPGGAIEENENLPKAIKREIQEETGLMDTTVHTILNTNAYVLEFSDCIKEIAHTTLLVTLESDEPVILSGEHQAFAWITKEEFFSYTFSRHNRESLMKYFNITA